MEQNAVWSESCEVRFAAIDASDSMSLSAVFNFFQEAAISHAHQLGVGRADMAQANQVWILSRMSVLVERRPAYGEIVRVRTWPRGGEKLFALRDFDISGADGKAAVRARSCWIIIDLEKRRPLRPQAVMDRLPQNEGLDSLPAAIGLEANPSLHKNTERRVRYSDIDYNGHVNNVSYIRWIEDAVDPALLEQARQMRLDINYLNEIVINEAVGIWSTAFSPPAETPAPAQAFAFEGRKDPGDQAAFRAELRLW